MVMLSKAYGVVWVHIYKTGGSSLTHLLASMGILDSSARTASIEERPGWQSGWHLQLQQHGFLEPSLTELASAFPDQRSWTAAAIVRNPYAWHESIWRNFYSGKHSPAPAEFEAASSSLGFPDYLRFVAKVTGAGLGRHPGSTTQSAFLATRRPIAVKVARLENFDDSVTALLHLLGVGSPPAPVIPHRLDRGDKVNLREIYDDDAVARVNQLAGSDFTRFGYRRATSAQQLTGDFLHSVFRGSPCLSLRSWTG